MSEYSNYVMGEVDLETEKAYLFKLHPILANFHCRKTLWIPKSIIK